jgi:hypothetical protein
MDLNFTSVYADISLQVTSYALNEIYFILFFTTPVNCFCSWAEANAAAKCPAPARAGIA